MRSSRRRTLLLAVIGALVLPVSARRRRGLADAPGHDDRAVPGGRQCRRAGARARGRARARSSGSSSSSTTARARAATSAAPRSRRRRRTATPCMFGTPGPIATNKLMYKSLPYDPEKDLTPVVLVAKSPLIVVAHPVVPGQGSEGADRLCQGQSRQGQCRQSRQRHARPASPRSCCSSTPATKMTHVPYRGTAPLTTDLLGGQINVGLRLHVDLHPAGERRQAARARRHVERAGAEPARCDDRAGSGLQGFRGDRLVRDRRADRHAGRRDRRRSTRSPTAISTARRARRSSTCSPCRPRAARRTI